jgi:osmotically-inducible protein OsmY
MQITDEQVCGAVAEELDWDPKLDNSAITVSADAGVVTLSGAVSSVIEKSAAKRDALRVRGVVRVEDRLQVEVLDEHRCDDALLRSAVQQALRLDSLVPSTVDAEAADGWITLLGKASSQFQRTQAQQVTERVRGVRGVSNEISLVPFGPSAGDLAAVITKAMKRSARLAASNISVESSDGTVTLCGTVPSWADHDDAMESAWNAPGVLHVVDDLRVAY